jgi:hypothetical protein
LARYNAVNARAEDVAQQGFTPYGGQFVAPLTQTQQAGIANVSQAAGAAQPYYQAAGTALLGGAAQAQPYYQAATQNIYGAQAAAAPLQTAAAQNIAGAQAAGQPYQGMATGFGLAGARQIAPGGLNVGAYMSPYTEAVAQPTYQALRQQQEQERQRILGEQIRGGAFGGDRGRIAQANLAQQQNLATAQALGNIYQQGYGQALGAAQQQQGVALQAEQANRQAQQQAAQQFLGIGQQAFGQGAQTAQQQAALGQQLFGQGAQAAQTQQALGQGLYGIGAGVSQGLAGLGTGAQQAALQGGQAQLAAGTVEQQTQQAQNQALYNQFLQQQGYPFQVAQFLANIAMGTGALSGSTTTTTQPQSFFSDERLKHDIEPIGKTYDGQEIVRFKYKGEPGTRIGLVAQDVEKKHPEAVGLAGGYKTVDYDKATDEAAERAPHKAYGGGLSPWDGSSMGGGVFREDAGQGFAAGGAPGGDDILAQINQLVNAHQGIYPYGKSGLYGASSGKSGPYGSSLMQVSPRLMTATPHRMPEPGAVKFLENVGRVGAAAETGSKGASWVGRQASLSPEYQAQGPTPSGAPISEPRTIADYADIARRRVESAFSNPNEPSGATQPSNVPPYAHGGLVRRGLAVGGLPYSQAEDEYVPEDISKPFTPGKLETAKPPAQQPSGFEQALKLAGTAASIYGGFKSAGGSIRRAYEEGGASSDEDNFGLENAKIYSGGLAPDYRPSSILQQDRSDERQKGLQAAQVNPGVLQPSSGGLAPSDAGGGLGGLANVGSLYNLGSKAWEAVGPWLGEAAAGAGEWLGSLAAEEGLALAAEEAAPYAVALLARGGGLMPRKGYQPGGEVTVPEEWQPHIQEASRRYGVPEHILTAVARQESGYGRAAPDNPMQIIESTAREPGFGLSPISREDRARPEAFLPWAAQYIAARNPNMNWEDRPAAARALATTYNAGGDPNYAHNVGRYLPGITPEELAGLRVNVSNEQPRQPQAGLGAVQPEALPILQGLTTRRDPESKDFMQRNQDWIVPLLTGLGTMAASPSRYLGSAVLQGLGGGALQYAGMQQRGEEQAIQREQVDVSRLREINQAMQMQEQMRQRLLESFGPRLEGDVYINPYTGERVSPQQRMAIVNAMMSNMARQMGLPAMTGAEAAGGLPPGQRPGGESVAPPAGATPPAGAAPPAGGTTGPSGLVTPATGAERSAAPDAALAGTGRGPDITSAFNVDTSSLRGQNNPDTLEQEASALFEQARSATQGGFGQNALIYQKQAEDKIKRADDIRGGRISVRDVNGQLFRGFAQAEQLRVRYEEEQKALTNEYARHASEGIRVDDTLRSMTRNFQSGAQLGAGANQLAAVAGYIQTVLGPQNANGPGLQAMNNFVRAVEVGNKDAIMLAFSNLQKTNMSRGTNLALQEMLAMVAEPRMSPSARYEIVTRARAEIARDNAFYESAMERDPRESIGAFQARWNANPENRIENFTRQVRAETRGFTGMSPQEIRRFGAKDAAIPQPLQDKEGLQYDKDTGQFRAPIGQNAQGQPIFEYYDINGRPERERRRP